MNEEKEKSLVLRIVWFCLKSPVSVFLGAALIYYAFQAYILGNSPWINKIVMLGIVCLWFIWVIARHAFKLLLVLILVGAVLYGYYRFVNYDADRCEESGGVWNKQTKTCVEKTGWMHEIQQLIKKYSKN